MRTFQFFFFPFEEYSTQISSKKVDFLPFEICNERKDFEPYTFFPSPAMDRYISFFMTHHVSRCISSKLIFVNSFFLYLYFCNIQIILKNKQYIFKSFFFFKCEMDWVQQNRAKLHQVKLRKRDLKLYFSLRLNVKDTSFLCNYFSFEISFLVLIFKRRKLITRWIPIYYPSHFPLKMRSDLFLLKSIDMIPKFYFHNT